jgi:hypothetical protein
MSAASAKKVPSNNNNNNNKPKETISESEWNSYSSRISLTKQDLNGLISNLLFTEGISSVAQSFDQESSTQQILPLSFLHERSVIKENILSGNIPAAINQLNAYNPDVLESNNNLLFELQLQQCIELITNNSVDKALDFIIQQLAPAAMNNEQLSNSLLNILSLLALNNLNNSPQTNLIKPQQRYNLAQNVNEAILQAQHHNKESHLTVLLKKLIFQQNLLAEQNNFPKQNQINLTNATK